MKKIIAKKVIYKTLEILMSMQWFYPLLLRSKRYKCITVLIFQFSQWNCLYCFVWFGMVLNQVFDWSKNQVKNFLEFPLWNFLIHLNDLVFNASTSQLCMSNKISFSCWNCDSSNSISDKNHFFLFFFNFHIFFSSIYNKPHQYIIQTWKLNNLKPYSFIV